MNVKEKEPEINLEPEKKPKKPTDLLSIYMEIRQNLASQGSFHLSYMALLSLIDMGKEMLPPSENTLRAKAENLLMNKIIYPKSRQMNLTGGIYRLGSGDTGGTINVLPEDLDSGIIEMQNQQAMALIPELKYVDGQIFHTLVKHEIITIKKPSLRDEIMAGFIKDFRKKVK